MRFERPRKKHKHIELTPLVDVMFNLLLFFILTYQVSRYSQIKINLPQSKLKETPQQGIEIEITSDYRLYFNGKIIKLKELSRKLEEMPKKEVLIKADREVKIDFLVKVLDEIKLRGFEDVGIITQED